MRQHSCAVYEEGLKQVLIKEIEGIKEAGTYKVEREITSPQVLTSAVQKLSPYRGLNCFFLRTIFDNEDYGYYTRTISL